ncbi:hypothetical protein BO70DRAFT_395273 [Aspergillus heteromorphus CBS 117.55]|uniref:Uncharacterized protein n=1 Tax=Aspergillus heteromorphus CBS 117.55 TaxID=1448321 RepID=A0A317WPD0_9EURO|nr:uncharacterized protein BO70DRAFT_395273 [Aspergillus heteromorphus CBS 117.55]PWY86150.1 hypothetical protein BO70DRAFT_395273 [Aspergillus heteromorphus CBS 117.55]
MGIVVSEDGNVGGPIEQQKIDNIAAENDYGLIMATLDQVSVFLGSWWTTSLLGRIQTFRSYTDLPLLSIVRHERAAYGILGFYFAGIPAWAVSTCISFCRHHPLERLIASIQNHFSNDDFGSKLVRAMLNVLHSATRGTLLVLGIQTYMYSLLQSLHLVHSYSMPGLKFFLPFGELAAMQLPKLPAQLSVQSLSGFVWNFLKTPSLLVYIYVYLRPVFEIRLYRFIRRRLPKPIYADELSVKVAYENDLVDWMMPALGRRSEEENRRSNMSFTEDLVYEINFLRAWVLSWFGFKSLRTARASEQAADARRRPEWLEALPQSIEQLQHERLSRTRRPRRRSSEPPLIEGQRNHNRPRSSSPSRRSTGQELGPGIDFGGNQVLTNEENRMSQSPTEMSSGDFAEMAPLRRARTMPPPDDSSTLANAESQRGEASETQRNSRSNTLFSRPSSPETSSPGSPRVRASLIHQNSDVITMQLELLGTRLSQNQGQANPRAANNESDQVPSNGQTVVDGQTISEFLDNLMSNQGRNLTTVVSSDAMDSDGLSNMTTSVSPRPGDDILDSDTQGHLQSPEAEVPTVGAPTSEPVNILPESIEEPTQTDALQSTEVDRTQENDFDSEIFPHISDPNIRQNMPANTSATAHRVTILSSHPVDSLASHLAAIITNVMFIPLESFFLRSLAASYLAAKGAPAVLRSEVRGIGFWTWGSRSDIIPYMGKIVLMVGLQAAVNASVWGIFSGAAIKIGRKFCGWGAL